MLRPVIAIAAAAIVALAGMPATAEAAPFNAAALKTATDGSDLVQVRGGRGGGGGFRGGNFGGGHRFGGGNFGRGHRFGGNHHAGNRHRPPVGCRAIWCKPSHGHGHKRKGITIVIGGGYDNGPGCGEFYRRWQATGSSYWRSEYYACIGE